MGFEAVRTHKLLQPAVGAVLAGCCGLALWWMPLGEQWVSASYDYLFRFGARAVTNPVVLVLMDNEAYARYRQERGKPWGRKLHADLLNKLTADGCPLVIFDVFFRSQGDPGEDTALAEAMRRHGRVVLMAEQAEASHPTLATARPILPCEPFLSAAGTNWGVAWLDPDLDLIVRRHWPFPSPGPYLSLPVAAALQTGAPVSTVPQRRWLRFYGRRGQWTSLSYPFAFTQATNLFRNKIVFVGNKPKTTVPDGEVDEFRTPYTRWSGMSSGGVEIMATAFLNLVNGDWLRRAAPWLEALALVTSGLLLGGGLCRVGRLPAFWLAAGAALAVTLGAVWWSSISNYWFPWLVIVGGQIPCALAWALLAPSIERARRASSRTLLVPTPEGGMARADLAQDLPDAPDYELISPPFAEGAYGKVWLARNAVGQWQAVKAIYGAKFGNDTLPYDREFRGIREFKPVSDKHPGLLRIDFVSRKKPGGYFYYVMELGDALEPGWEHNPALYKPCDLASLLARAEEQRLPVPDCLRIGMDLVEALGFLHQEGLTHRDIKPRNIIFVDGRPKLADVGLVAEIRPLGKGSSRVGTPGYMPQPPEPLGTPQADIYGLGMVLYVISTGHDPDSFPVLPNTLIQDARWGDFMWLNNIIIKACQPEPAQRYASAAEMGVALREAQRAIEHHRTPEEI